MSDVSSLENDLRAIEALNQRDVQAALAGDAAMMMSQWTDDIVLLPPAGHIMRGRIAIAEAFRGVENPGMVEYVLDIQEVQILGDHAFQWGDVPIYCATARGRRDGPDEWQDHAHSSASAGGVLEDPSRDKHR